MNSSAFASQPDWLWALLGADRQSEGSAFSSHGSQLELIRGIPRAQSVVSLAQEQTRDAFGFKWGKRETFEDGILGYMKLWLAEKYGPVSDWLHDLGDMPLVLDAGCGAAMSGLAYFGSVADSIRYLGVDVSEAVEVAAQRFAEKKLSGGFIQADLCSLPLAPESVDLVFSEGVLHHTDDTRSALAAVTRTLKPGGRMLLRVPSQRSDQRIH